MLRRSDALVVAVVFIAALDGAAAAKESPCTLRYVVRDVGGPLLAGGPDDADVVDLEASTIALRSGCSVSPVAVRPMKKGGWRLGAIFAPCRSFGRTRLRATLSADCTRL